MEQNAEFYHDPVMLTECMEGLNLKSGGVYIDVTYGGGGHSKEILRRLDSQSELYGFDQDKDAEKNVTSDSRFHFVRSNFRYLYNFMRYYNKVGCVNGILADLGLSSHHLDDPDRGFSFRDKEAKLDMRMNVRAELTAADVLNVYEPERLITIFKLYGDIKVASRLVRALVAQREVCLFETMGQLSDCVRPFENRASRGKLMTLVCQSLRMEVNDELAALKDVLMQARDVLAPGGRLVVMTYHSGEDRLVKRFFRDGSFDGGAEKDFYGNRLVPFKIVSKLIIPSEMEIAKNNRARSAKLRVVEKL
ncbi:MAG: 16S rRNA (cytosine(1402)-N(4))-methyltransferase RsmH [Massilibacteroides sp.]|nr:16S rRNA (cytosine(1402)-N(4))-methyltransferase RsmH [Massilibacteroides sp.]